MFIKLQPVPTPLDRPALGKQLRREQVNPSQTTAASQRRFGEVFAEEGSALFLRTTVRSMLRECPLTPYCVRDRPHPHIKSCAHVTSLEISREPLATSQLGAKRRGPGRGGQSDLRFINARGRDDHRQQTQPKAHGQRDEAERGDQANRHKHGGEKESGSEHGNEGHVGHCTDVPSVPGLPFRQQLIESSHCVLDAAIRHELRANSQRAGGRSDGRHGPRTPCGRNGLRIAPRALLTSAECCCTKAEPAVRAAEVGRSPGNRKMHFSVPARSKERLACYRRNQVRRASARLMNGGSQRDRVGLT